MTIYNARRAASDMTPCIICGSFGSSAFNKCRIPLFKLCFALMFLSFIFTLAALFPSTSTDNTTIEDTNWVWVEADGENIGNDFQMFMNLKRYHSTVYAPSTTLFSGTILSDEAFNYRSDRCMEDFCKTCEQAGYDVLGTLFVSFMCQIITVFLLYIRGWGKDDNAVKSVSVFLSIFGFVCILSGLSLFSANCYDQLNYNYPNIQYHFGPGYALMVCVMLCYFPVALVLILTAVTVDPKVLEADFKMAIARQKKLAEEKKKKKEEPKAAASKQIVIEDDDNKEEDNTLESKGITIHLE